MYRLIIFVHADLCKDKMNKRSNKQKKQYIQKNLRDRELNPGLPRDKRKF